MDISRRMETSRQWLEDEVNDSGDKPKKEKKKKISAKDTSVKASAAGNSDHPQEGATANPKLPPVIHSNVGGAKKEEKSVKSPVSKKEEKKAKSSTPQKQADADDERVSYHCPKCSRNFDLFAKTAGASISNHMRKCNPDAYAAAKGQTSPQKSKSPVKVQQGALKRKSFSSTEEDEDEDSRQHNDLCETCGEGGELLCCSTCNLVFHMGCTRPKVACMPDDDWSCAFCIASGDSVAFANTSEEAQQKARLAIREIQALKEEVKRHASGAAAGAGTLKSPPKPSKLSKEANAPQRVYTDDERVAFRCPRCSRDFDLFAKTAGASISNHMRKCNPEAHAAAKAQASPKRPGKVESPEKVPSAASTILGQNVSKPTLKPTVATSPKPTPKKPSTHHPVQPQGDDVILSLRKPRYKEVMFAKFQELGRHLGGKDETKQLHEIKHEILAFFKQGMGEGGRFLKSDRGMNETWVVGDDDALESE